LRNYSTVFASLLMAIRVFCLLFCFCHILLNAAIEEPCLFPEKCENMKRIILCVLLILNFGCKKSQQNDFKQLSVNPFLIAKENLYGNGRENIAPQNTIVTNQNDWIILINKMNLINNVSNSFSTTTVDFSSYQLIAVFDSIKLYGGYSIDITDVTENENSINVTVEHLLPGSENPVVTQPFHIVRIPISNKPIVFE
jgi:hypothetical protein